MEHKNVGIRLDAVMEKLSPNAQKGGVVIYTHDVHLFAYQADLENMVYRIDDERLYDTDSLWENADKFRQYADLVIDLFITALNSGKLVIQIPFGSFIASVLEAFLTALQTGKGFRFLALSFFHNDRETEKMLAGEVKNVMEKKAFLIEVMLLYPHIKTEEIPIGALLAEDYLVRLVQKYRK